MHRRMSLQAREDDGGFRAALQRKADANERRLQAVRRATAAAEQQPPQPPSEPPSEQLSQPPLVTASCVDAEPYDDDELLFAASQPPSQQRSQRGNAALEASHAELLSSQRAAHPTAQQRQRELLMQV